MPETLEGLLIQRWAHGGDAVGVPERGPLAGAIVFVPGAVPGDRVTARVVQRKRRWARAEILKIEAPSPHRVTPACPLQAACGGCPWMAGDHAAQAASRLAILRGEARKRLGWTDERVAERVALAGAPAPSLGYGVGYRVRLRMAYRVAGDGRVTLGFRSAGTQRLVDVPECVVAAPALNAALPEARRQLAARGPGEGELQLLAGREGVAGLVKPVLGSSWGFGPERVTVVQGALELEAAPDAFVQANPEVVAAMTRRVRELAAGVMPPGGHAVELFAGSGTFTVPLLEAGYRVTAYEVAPDARAAFERVTAGRGEATWQRCDLFATGVPTPAPAAPDLVLLDPPRVGAAEVMPWVRSSGARAVVLVSCDVATGFRDLAQLVEAGWDVAEVTGYDMFPHTGHQEMLSLVVPPRG